MIEIFKPHPISGYMVSNTGRIINPLTGYELVLTKKPGFYVMCGQLVTKSGSVHRAVVETFLGQIPKGLEVNHIDGDKTNNNLSNLEVVTKSENMQHAYRLGLAEGRKGEYNSSSKLKEKEVLQIYGLFEMGYNNEYIGEKFCVHPRYVSLLRHGKRWEYLYGEQGKTFPKSFTVGAYSLSQMIEAIEMLRVGSTNKEISDSTGIEKSNISRLRSGQLWRDFVKFYESKA